MWYVIGVLLSMMASCVSDYYKEPPEDNSSFFAHVRHWFFEKSPENWGSWIMTTVMTFCSVDQIAGGGKWWMYLAAGSIVEKFGANVTESCITAVVRRRQQQA